MSEPAVLADLSELQALGVLQEANRRFFHPLGLALCWELGSEGENRVVGVLDARDDPEGFVFLDLSDAESLAKAERVAELRSKFSTARRQLFGAEVQPIGDVRPA